MQNEHLKKRVNKLTDYTDNVTPAQWVELVEELVSEINSLEAEIDTVKNKEVYE